ncbi:hypothetical protein PanWU01x14_096260, partial [Parasponia andersonii]
MGGGRWKVQARLKGRVGEDEILTRAIEQLCEFVMLELGTAGAFEELRKLSCSSNPIL